VTEVGVLVNLPKGVGIVGDRVGGVGDCIFILVAFVFVRDGVGGDGDIVVGFVWDGVGGDGDCILVLAAFVFVLDGVGGDGDGIFLSSLYFYSNGIVVVQMGLSSRWWL